MEAVLAHLGYWSDLLDVRSGQDDIVILDCCEVLSRLGLSDCASQVTSGAMKLLIDSAVGGEGVVGKE